MGTLKNSLTANPLVSGPLAVKLAAAGVAVLVAAGAAGAAMWANSTANEAAASYKASREKLDASLQAATKQGYTAADLAPVTEQERALDDSQKPWLVLGQPGYYDGLTSRTTSLRRQLTTLE